MKKKFLVAAFALLFVAAFGFSNAQAQKLEAQVAPVKEIKEKPIISGSSCNMIVGTGCVGDCSGPGGGGAAVARSAGNPQITYVVPGNVPFQFLCLQTDASSLCPNTGAFARIYRNGVQVAQGDITAVGSTISFFALSGDIVTVEVSLFGINNNIDCVWLGNLNFSLRK